MRIREGELTISNDKKIRINKIATVSWLVHPLIPTAQRK